MSNILTISPISIAGSLIINGLAKGFKQLGHNIICFDVRELDKAKILKFKPDFVIGYDYVHFIDSKAEETIKNLNIPVIHYFADDPNANFAHSGNLELINKLSNSDGIVFCWDRTFIQDFKNKTYYLPLGVDPDLYIPDNHNITERSEIVFAGRPLTDVRLTALCSIIKNYPDKLHIYSYKKHFETSIEHIKQNGLLNSKQLEYYQNSYKGFITTEKELATIYNNSKISLNITMDQGINSMNYRVMEVLASEGFLLTDYKQDTAEYFSPDEELVFYNDNDSLLDKISLYLENTELRAKIARQGKEKIIQNHTFKHRAQEILNKLTI